ncbi:MAG: ATP-dependent helicase [Bacteroidetes bacterium SW_9_63_38]|nr:MAG: ATP-dependent helicase [Bacteroidetes bacterium SW_9_63_38]
MVSADALTPEQRAVTQHADGPAAVLAVPGAGKTTALVHRIRMLVEERGVAPDRILVCSFNRQTVDDLTDALHAIGVSDVQPRTLHSLGHALRHASMGPLSDDAPDPSTAAHRLARRVLRDEADHSDLDVADLEVTTADLVDQVAAWKQQLAYPDLDRADLPPTAYDTASAASADDDILLNLYSRFEAHRRDRDWVTYADMLRDGWEALVRNDVLRERTQQAYEHVVVDEFQDVSRAQYEILDLLTADHRNYMVVGDDDQSIYRWRGARASFLLDFADTYDATTYRMMDSFRLPLGPTVLANAVIQNNEDRHDKRIRLTQSDGGPTRLLDETDAPALANAVAEQIDGLLSESYAPADLAVLVRTYGETPPLEVAMLDRGLPYTVDGHVPFYRRRPVQTLLRYLYWALLERRRRRTGGFDQPETAQQYQNRFAQIVNHPNRYVPRGRIDRILQEARRKDISLFAITESHLPAMDADLRDRVSAFLEMLETLVARLDASPAVLLEDLTASLGYAAYLREQSVRPEQGEARVRTMNALLRYATSFDSVPALIEGVRSLAAGHERESDPSAVTVRSIHRAKGAEWPVVFVPGGVEGTLPHTPAEKSDAALAEERRLFYVAITRAQEHLYLGTHEDGGRSRFLQEANAESLLDRCETVQRILTAPPQTVTEEAVARFCNAVGTLRLGTFFQDWWTPAPDRAETLRSHLSSLPSTVEAAHRRVEAAKEAQRTYETEIARLRDEASAQVEQLRTALGTAPISATHTATETYYPDSAAFTFDWTEDESAVMIHWNDTVVGRIDPLGAGRLDAETVFSIPWSGIVARFDSVSNGRARLHLTIDWEETSGRLLAQKRATLSPPASPDAFTHLLTSEDFRTGYERLHDRLSD